MEIAFEFLCTACLRSINVKVTRSPNEIVTFLNSRILHEVISLSWPPVSFKLTSLFVSKRRLAEFHSYKNLLK